jgi:hypothetical protein
MRVPSGEHPTVRQRAIILFFALGAVLALLWTLSWAAGRQGGGGPGPGGASPVAERTRLLQEIQAARKALTEREAADEALSARAQRLEEKAAELEAALAVLSASAGDTESRRGSDLAKLGAELRAEMKTATLEEAERLLRAEREERRAELERLEGALIAVDRALARQAERAPGAAPGRTETGGSPPPPAVATTVEAVEGNGGVVVLGAGKEKGLETGHVLQLSRGGKRIGSVRVLKVYGNLAGAEIVEVAPGEDVQRGDEARLGVPAPTAEPVGARSAPAGEAGPAPAAGAASRDR